MIDGRMEPGIIHKPGFSEDFLGETERRTTAYLDVREDSSTGSTTKIPKKAGCGRSLFSFDGSDKIILPIIADGGGGQTI
jgi:RPE1 domain-containing protein